jgi:hypothetical protein
MKQKCYTAQTDVGVIAVYVTLGKPEAKICVSDKNLNWNDAVLNKEQLEGLIKFLTEFPKE